MTKAQSKIGPLPLQLYSSLQSGRENAEFKRLCSRSQPGAVLKTHSYQRVSTS